MTLGTSIVKKLRPKLTLLLSEYVQYRSRRFLGIKIGPGRFI